MIGKLHLMKSIKAIIFLIVFNSLYSSQYFEFDKSNYYSPTSIEQLKHILNVAKEKNKKICLVGTGKSQGGQSFAPNNYSSFRISLDKFDKLISLNLEKKEVTVQAGMTWKKLQEIIKPYNLSIRCMQSYNDFSIGGSLSVNVHGQDAKDTPLIKTIRSIKILTSNGEIKFCNRQQNYELFKLAVGGYGLFGIILEATLSLTTNVFLKTNVYDIPTKELADLFQKNIKNNNKVEFFSARFSLGSTDLLDRALIICYEKTENEKNLESDVPAYQKHYIQKKALQLMEYFQCLKNTRFDIEKMYLKKPIKVWRNTFMGNSINDLPQDTKDKQYILQEYFIPYEQLNGFIENLKSIIKQYKINLLNVTARDVRNDEESFLSFANQDCCALVLYINIDKFENSYLDVMEWTRLLIDKTIELKGRYYLPYQLLATRNQIRKAYPQFNEFIQLKKKYDPSELFVNQLYWQYK